MSAEDCKGISVQILGREHQFTCSAEEVEDLKQAASNLAAMCDDIKLQSNTASSERALLVASINLSHSLLMANKIIESDRHKQSALIAKLKSIL